MANSGLELCSIKMVNALYIYGTYDPKNERQTKPNSGKSTAYTEEQYTSQSSTIVTAPVVDTVNTE
jgi:hypothetical protein